MEKTIRNGRARALRAAAGALALVAALGLGGCSLFTPSPAEVADDAAEASVSDDELVNPGVLTVALDTSDAPQAMTGTDGELTGYAVDVSRALAKSLGLKAKIVDAANAKNSVAAGEADVFLGTPSDDAPDGVTVVGDYLEDASAVFGKTDGSSASSVSVSDLTGKKIAVQASSASQDALSRAGVTAEYTSCSNVNECFEVLGSGKVDYVACDATAGAYVARGYAGVGFLGTISSTKSYGIAMSSKISGLSQKLSEAYAAMSGDGTLDAIHTAWYGSMPRSIADTLLSGVTLEDAASATGADDASGTADAAATGTEATGTEADASTGADAAADAGAAEGTA